MDGARAPRPSILIPAALVGVLLAHAPAVGGSFIWDDYQIVIGSPLVTAKPRFTEFFDSAFFSNQETEPGGRGYYRPLTVFTWALDHALHGANGSGYHITNLILHLVNTALLLLLIRRTGASVLAASVAAALWGTMPRLTEAVSWISGRTDVLAATCVLAALVIWNRESWPRRIGAALFLFGGLLSKEVALAGVVAILWLELRRADTPWKARVLATLPVLLACLAYAALRIRAIGATPSGRLLLGTRRISAAFEAIGRYTQSVLDPWRPDAQIGRILLVDWVYVGVGVVSVLALAFLTFRFLKRRPRHELEAAGILMTGVSIALVLHLLPIALNIVVADRFLYLPLAGLALTLTRSVAALLGKLRMPIRVAALAAFAASLGICTFYRARAWTDEIEFWTFAYKQNPINNGAASIELGNIFFRAGLHHHALGVYRSYHDDGAVNNGMVGNNMGMALQSLGYYKTARHVLRQVVSLYPDIPKFRFNLALTELSVGNYDAARREIAATLRLFPGHSVAKTVRDRLPKLETEAKDLSGDSMPALLRRSRHAVEVARTKEAVDLMLQAMSKGILSRADAENALYFAAKFADPPSYAGVYRGYVKAMGGTAPPAIADAFELRNATTRRLLALWPSLGLSLPPLGDAR